MDGFWPRRNGCKRNAIAGCCIDRLLDRWRKILANPFADKDHIKGIGYLRGERVGVIAVALVTNLVMILWFRTSPA